MLCVSTADGWLIMLFPALNHTGAISLIKRAEVVPGNNILIHYLCTEAFFFTACSVWIHWEVSMCCGTISLLGGHNRDSINFIDRAAPLTGVVLAAPGAVSTSNIRRRELFVPSSAPESHFCSEHWWLNRLLSLQ